MTAKVYYDLSSISEIGPNFKKDSKGLLDDKIYDKTAKTL